MFFFNFWDFFSELHGRLYMPFIYSRTKQGVTFTLESIL